MKNGICKIAIALLTVIITTVMVWPVSTHAGAAVKNVESQTVTYDRAVVGKEYTLTAVKGTPDDYQITESTILGIDEQTAGSTSITMTVAFDAAAEPYVVLLSSNDNINTYPLVMKEVKKPQTITASDLTVVSGKTRSIGAYARGPLSYSSSSSAIARISGSSVTGVRPGRAKITVKAAAYAGYLAASKTVTVTVTPTVTAVSTAKSYHKKTLTVKWKKNSTAAGYQISVSGKRAAVKIVKTIAENKTVSYTKTKLKRHKYYYVKIRAYKTVSGSRIYSPWSAIVKARVK